MEQRPNFLIIMTEQHRGDCIGSDGHPFLLTPNIDEIGGKGVRFSRAYTTCPLCIPTRHSFLTGQFPSTHGVFNNQDVGWDGNSMDVEWEGRTVAGRSLLPLLQGRERNWRPHLHLECSPDFHCLTDGKEKYIWFVSDGREQLFDPEGDPGELHDLAVDTEAEERLASRRVKMVQELENRPEGFSDGMRLIPGWPYPMRRGGDQ